MTPEETRHRWVKKAQEISRLLNSDKARAALIGRAAFNPHLGRQMLATADLDFLCGSIPDAMECVHLLESSGYKRMGAVFADHAIEVDLITADPSFPYGDVGGLLNIPDLHRLWEHRTEIDGILVIELPALFIDKLKHIRSLEKDEESVLKLTDQKPETMDAVIEAAKEMSEEEVWEVLSALYACFSEENPKRDGGKDARGTCKTTPRKAIDMGERSQAERSLAVSSGKRVRKKGLLLLLAHMETYAVPDAKECDLGRALSVSLGETFLLEPLQVIYAERVPEGSRRLSSPSEVEESILNGDVIVVRLPQEQLEAIIAKPAKQEDRCQKNPSSC